MIKVKVPVTWQMSGYVEVEVDDNKCKKLNSKKIGEKAVEKFYEVEDSTTLFELPDGEYIDGSFELESENFYEYDDIFLEAFKNKEI